MRFSSCETEKDHFRDNQGKHIRTENKESFESKVLDESNIELQLPLLSWFCKLTITFSSSGNISVIFYPAIKFGP